MSSVKAVQPRSVDGLYRVGHARPHHSITLSRLFRRALQNDFAYYSDDFLAATRSQNTPARLALASLRSDRLLLGLWTGRDLVGYLIGATRPGSDCGDIFWLFVEPEHRGHGLGADLLAAAIRWLQDKNLRSVELVTYDHASFYEKQGFSTERLAEGFIGGQDVYIMRMSLV